MSVSTGVSLVTAALAVLGFVWAVFRFVAEQRLQRRRHILEQARQDLEQLVSLPTREKGVLSHCRFLLDDLRAMCADEPAIAERVTAVLIDMASYDYSYDRLEHCQLAGFAMAGWPEMRTELQNDASKNAFITYRLRQGLRAVIEEDPEYFRTMTAEAGAPFRVNRFTDERRYLKFERLFSTVAVHLSIAPEEHGFLAGELAELGSVLQNESLLARAKEDVLRLRTG